MFILTPEVSISSMTRHVLCATSTFPRHIRATVYFSWDTTITAFNFGIFHVGTLYGSKTPVCQKEADQ